MLFFNNDYYEHFPRINIPNINLGKIDVPAPKIDVPAPRINVPDAPRINAPAAPRINAPDAPRINAPDAPRINAPDAPRIDAPDAPRIDAPSKKSLGTDYTKYPEGSAQRRFSYDNYLKSGKNPPKVLDDPPKVNKVSDDLNKIDNIDNIKNVDDIPNDDIKKIVKSSPEDIKADLPDAQKADFDVNAKKLFDDIDTPDFKSKTPKEKWDSVKKWVKENIGTMAAAAAGAAILGIYLKSKIDADRINNTEYKITSITSDANDEVIVLYDPRDKFSLKDTIIISETNSVPVIDGSGMDLKYVGNGVVSFSGEKITTNGTSGKLICRTTVENQFTQNVTDALEPVVDIPANVVENVLDKIIPKGLKDFFKNFWWVILIICILSLISSSAAVGFVYLNN